RGGHLLRGYQAEPELAVADADGIARLQLVSGDRLAVDPGAAGAAAVGQDDLAVPKLDLAVDPSHPRVGQVGIGILAPANPERLPIVKRETVPLIRSEGHQ